MTKETQLVTKLLSELKAINNELDHLYGNKRFFPDSEAQIDEAMLIRRILMDIEEFLPKNRAKLVELPSDPILIDYLEERGYKEAADILRG